MKRRLAQLTKLRRAQKATDVADKAELKVEEEVAKEKLRTWLKNNDVKFHPQLGFKKLKALKVQTQKELK